MRVDCGVAEGDSVPPEFDSMIAKIIAHGDTREQAIARLRRAVADTMVAIDDGTTNQGFLLELLGRPELRAGDVDTGWLDRLQARATSSPCATPTPRSSRPRSRSATPPRPPSAARFYALARRGRPHADAEPCHALDLLHRGVELPLRGLPDRARAATCSRSTAPASRRPSRS